MIWRLVFFLVKLVALAVVAVLAVSLVRGLLWRGGARLAQKREEREQRDSQGRPLPPSGRGFCDQCGHRFDQVFFMPSGERRCRRCYDDMDRE